ncbi:MAG: tRNA lysidine(34) synthetase TilS [Clostridia bacterium]|nr:tRNA lysidine(34) synthetase TilS [Clostridia bacterium]
MDGAVSERDAARDLKERVESYILENGLLSDGDSILVGLSGGADSSALLYVLTRLSRRHGWTVRAAHFNHMIRGAEADGDESFCRGLAEAWGVPFYSDSADVPAYAKENGLSLETAGRLLRYDFLERIRAKTDTKYIATAHHMNDNAESILLHLLRGSGLAGLLGIKPKRGDIIRPLLAVKRDEIERYLELEGVPYRTDETNFIPEGSRNRVRLKLLPYVEKNINPGIVTTLCSMSELLSRDEEYLMDEARRAREALMKDGGLLRKELNALPYPIKTRVLRLELAERNAIIDVERKHLDAILEMLSGRTGSRLTIPGIEVRTSYGLVKFGKPSRKKADFEIPLAVGLIETPLGSFRTELSEGTEGFRKDPNVLFMDADKLGALGAPAVIRPRSEGLKFMPVGAPGTKKLKDYFIDRKVDRETRDSLPLITSGSDVLFIPGFASSALVSVDGSTERMIRTEFLRKD